MGVSFPAVQLQARGQGHAHKEIICDSGLLAAYWFREGTVIVTFAPFLHCQELTF